MSHRIAGALPWFIIAVGLPLYVWTESWPSVKRWKRRLLWRRNPMLARRLEQEEKKRDAARS